MVTKLEIERGMSAEFDGSEDGAVPEEGVTVDESIGSVVGQVRKGAGIYDHHNFRKFALAQAADDLENPRKRVRRSPFAPESPSILKALQSAEGLRERQREDGTHFSVRNLMEKVEIPEGATHQITSGALEGQYVVIVENGSKGSVKVNIVGGRRNGSISFIMPADLKKL
jgi:hypothetical protein